MAAIGRDGVPVLRVTTDDGRQYRFVTPFEIGRAEACHVRIYDGGVSRQHVAVWPAGDRWFAKDQGSTSGLFVAETPVSGVEIPPAVTLSLGLHGPTVSLEVESTDRPSSGVGPAAAAPTYAETGEEALARARAKYEARDNPHQPAGRETQIVRQLLSRQRRTYRLVAGALTVAVLVVGAAWIRARWENEKHRDQLAEQFYRWKELDVDIANLQRQLGAVATENSELRATLAQFTARRRTAIRAYDDQMGRLKLYDRDLTPEEIQILRVTRLFGECDAVVPMDYLTEVMRYIRQWQSTSRFVRGVGLAREKGYTRRIVDEFVGQQLPPEFFYLALQESTFDPLASGTKTRFGYAKGMWQFIPDTGQRYGLRIGPLAGVPRPDADDDRHKWDRATIAAAKYIKDIYSTEAQASGLLVMASYNWGEGNVLHLIKQLPQNPRQRNFWALQERFRGRIPDETYKYVFNIVAAAVIGSNPRMFGIDMDPPLAPFLPALTDAN